MRISVLVLDDVFDLGLSAILDAFQTANELRTMAPLDVAPFDVSVVGVRSYVRTAHGLNVPVAEQKDERHDCVIVPAIGFKMPAPLEKALRRPDVRDATDVLRSWASGGATMTAACIGTFIMAESGLLNGHEATTTWWLTPLFRQRYPKVKLNESQMVVASGSFVTTGAALSHMDLALWLIRHISPQLAALTARYLIVDSRSSQSAYALADHLMHSDVTVQKFERWAREHMSDRFSLDEAARAVGASKRTLARRTEDVLGKSPLQYFQAIRIERAVYLLSTSTMSVDEVAAEVGYVNAATLKTLLRREVGVGVKDIRRRA